MFWIFAAIAVVADQISKYVVATQMQLGQSIPVVKDVFHLTYVLNKGAAFSLLQGQRWFFVVVTLVVLGIIMWFLHDVPKNDRMMRATLGIFCGGTLGNFIDRLLNGAVVDFFDFRVFPVFNVADSFIVVGVILLGWHLLRTGSWPSAKAEREKAAAKAATVAESGEGEAQ